MVNDSGSTIASLLETRNSQKARDAELACRIIRRVAGRSGINALKRIVAQLRAGCWESLALKAHVADTVVPNLNATLAHHVLEKKGTEALLIMVTQDAELDLAKQREAHQRELRALHEAHAAHELKMIDQRNAQAKELREENLNVKAMEQELFELRGREDYLAQSLGEAEKDRRNVSDRLSSEQRRHKLSLQWRGLKAWTRVRSGNWLRDLIEIWHLNMVYDGKLMVMDLVEDPGPGHVCLERHGGHVPQRTALDSRPAQEKKGRTATQSTQSQHDLGSSVGQAQRGRAISDHRGRAR